MFTAKFAGNEVHHSTRTKEVWATGWDEWKATRAPHWLRRFLRPARQITVSTETTIHNICPHLTRPRDGDYPHFAYIMRPDFRRML